MIICADDFGISAGVSKGILELIDRGRVTAASCMVAKGLGPDDQMELIAERRELADIGLHLTLTDAEPLTDMAPEDGLVGEDGRFLGFNALMLNCYSGRVDRPQLEAEIRAQLLKFENLTGFQPHFIDGHQHVQQLPVISDLLIRACEDRMHDRYYIRCARFPLSWWTSSQLTWDMKLGSALIAIHGMSFRKKLRRSAIAHNDFLLGYYRPYRDSAFKHVFNGYTALSAGRNDVFHVHPGYVDQDLLDRDSLVETRLAELTFLEGEDFIQTIKERNIELNRFNYH